MIDHGADGQWHACWHGLGGASCAVRVVPEDFGHSGAATAGAGRGGCGGGGAPAGFSAAVMLRWRFSSMITRA